MKYPIRTWHWLILFSFITLAVITLFWLLLPDAWQVSESSDYHSYYAPVARSLLDGRGMERLDDSPATQYPPGFPFILVALFSISDRISFSEVSLLNLFTIICMVGSALLLLSIGQTLYPPHFAFIAVLLWLTYPFALWATKQPNSETAFLPIFLGAVALFWHSFRCEEYSYGRFFTVGILVGLAMLIRPAAIGLGFVLIFLLVNWRRREGVRGMVGPRKSDSTWECHRDIALANLWLYQQTGQIALLSTNGPASIRDGLTFAVNLKGYQGSPMIIQPDIQQVMQVVFTASAYFRLTSAR